MKFRTEIELRDVPFRLEADRPVLLLGSCFADNIGARMLQSGLDACVNPCATLYNPVSIALIMQLALAMRPERRMVVESSITEREGKFVSWFMGAVASGATPEECIDNVMERIDMLEKAIEDAQAMIITFGTPDVWLLKGTDCAVGNCHKHNPEEFEKKRLSIQDIISAWNALIGVLRQRNPEIKIIFTVSPRRYLAGGMADNSRQKSILLLACEALCASNSDTCYFPAFEILIDDLRDYRFYAADMLHPSDTAISYIWEKFSTHFFSETDLQILKKREKALRRQIHRPIL